MSIVYCPKCRSPNDDKLLAGGWLACAICNNRWFPTAATIDSLPTAEIAQSRVSTPRIAAKSAAPVPDAPLPPNTTSGEYLPDEPQTGGVARAALTGRVDGRQSGLAPAIREALPAVGVPASPTPPPAEPRPPTRAFLPVRGKLQAAHDPETGPTIDSDLFDRLEEEARYKRSEMKTIPELAVEDPLKFRTALPHNDLSAKIPCPVCGHAFPSTGSRHTCPQCGTAYDESSQCIVAGPGSKDNLLGRTLRGCLIDRKLGEGGMGAVYHAKQLSLDRSVAIKVLPVDLARNKNFIQRFEREAKSLARINHPNILQIYDFGEDPQLGLYFMIIEYVEGLDLGEVLNRRGLLGQIEVLDLLRQSVAGLESAAEKGVIHRDIKPDNLMIGSNGLVKVSDFGLAKGYVAQVGVTAAGVRVGTPAFMSPEQCDGVDVDFRSDIYNLGATAFLCLTGRLPFDGETPFAIMLKHKTEAVPSLCEVDPTIDDQVDRLIQRMLAKRPEDRCTSLRDLHEQIELLESQLAGTESVLRKSRGPFKAMLAGAPPMKAPGARQGGLSSGPLPVVRQVELVDLPSFVPEAPPAPVSLPPGLPALSASAPRGGTPPPPGRGSPRPGARRMPDPLPSIPPLEIAVPPAPAPERGAPRSSRRLDSELAQARERGRRSLLDGTMANADRLGRDGRFPEAAAEWSAAAELCAHDPVLQKDLRKRAAAARRRASAGRLLRRLALLLVLLAALAAAVWAAVPSVHNWLADQRLALLRGELEAVPEPRQRVTALRGFVRSNQPWEWYPALFRRSYRIAAAEIADALATELEHTAIAAPLVVTPVPTTRIAALRARVADPTVTWDTVAAEAAAVLTQAPTADDPAFRPVAEIARTATAELAAQRDDAARIAAARTAGDHAVALNLAEAYRRRHPRAFAALHRLPLPGRVRIQLTELAVPPDLTVTIDGKPVPLTPPVANDDGAVVDAVFCRSGDQATAVTVVADGCIPQPLRLPASAQATEQLETVTLRPAPLWSVAYADPRASGAFVPWARLASQAGNLLLQHQDCLLLLRSADGIRLATAERPTNASPTFTPLLAAAPADRIVTGLSDGAVQRWSAALVLEQDLHPRAAPEVLAWAEIQLAQQNNKPIQVVVERTAAGAELSGRDPGQVYWRYREPLRATGGLPPQIVVHDDRLVVIDDQNLRLIEEDGTPVQTIALRSPRSGPALEIPRAQAGISTMLIPCAGEVAVCTLGLRQNPLSLIADPVFRQAGPGQVARSGGRVIVAGDRQLAAIDLGAASVLRWRQPHSRPPVLAPVMDGTRVATVDDRGTVLIRANDTGALQQRIAHGTPLAGTPLIMALDDGPAVVVADRAGRVAAYRLKR